MLESDGSWNFRSEVPTSDCKHSSIATAYTGSSAASSTAAAGTGALLSIMPQMQMYSE